MENSMFLNGVIVYNGKSCELNSTGPNYVYFTRKEKPCWPAHYEECSSQNQNFLESVE